MPGNSSRLLCDPDYVIGLGVRRYFIADMHEDDASESMPLHLGNTHRNICGSYAVCEAIHFLTACLYRHDIVGYESRRRN